MARGFKKRYLAAAALAVVVLGGGVLAYTLTPTFHPGSPTELPELGRTGPYAIGTQSLSVPLQDRPQITASGTITGSADKQPRSVRLRLWYPSPVASGTKVSYERDLSRNPDEPLPVIFQGMAVESAPAYTDQSFPLVVMSHGYGGWAEHFSFLGEHIASHGYVVASIDHADPQPDGAISFVLSFGSVLQNRSLDQRQVISYLVAEAASATEGYARSIDATQIGLIGYSMGGYGAFRTAGAAYDYEGEGLDNLPRDSIAAMQEDRDVPPAIQAMIALAPWGGAPSNRSWTAEALAAIDIPLLIIGGNQDDVVNFDDGIRWLFDSASSSDRHLLVYREARHNIAGNAITDPAFPANKSFTTAEYMREPVWRTERLNAINQHFVTAFLDLNLKGDVDKSAYLTPPTVDANDSQWQIGFGEQLNGKLAGDAESSHWRGFQRRWAVGIELHNKAAGEGATE